MSNNNNNWIAHVKAFAAKNNISYACAVSMPECKATYVKEVVVKPVKEKKTKKEKKETKKIKIINKNILEAVALTPKKRKIIIKKKPEEVPVVTKPIKIIKSEKPVVTKKETLTNQKIMKMIKSIRKSMPDTEEQINKTMFKNKDNLKMETLIRIARRRGIPRKNFPDFSKLTPEERGAYIKDKLKFDLNKLEDLKELAETHNDIIDEKIYNIIKKDPKKYETSAKSWADLYIQQNKLKMTYNVPDSDEED